MLRLMAGFVLAAGLCQAAKDIVVIDSDSGLFGDDGAAAVMLLRSSSEVTISGITIVPGNVWAPQGAAYMLHILDLLKRPLVPVYIGATTPLVHTAAMARESERRWGKLEFMGAFADNPTEIKPPTVGSASARKPHHGGVEFLISEIEKHPGEVTVLAIGPMTNLALALRMKPEVETKIKRLVFMGGNVRVPGNASSSAEFNFWFDPESARMVLRSRIPHKVMFGLDICNKAPIKKPQFDEIVAVKTPVTELYSDDLGNRYPAFLKHADATGYMWDTLAAAYLLDPGFVKKSEVRYLDVLTVWGKFYGSTVALDRAVAPEATPVTVAVDLDFQRVFNLYKDRLTRRD